MADLFSRNAQRWLMVKNVDTLPAPPYALLAPTGVDSSGNITVTRPTSDSQSGLLVNGPLTIPPTMQGQAHQSFPAIIAYQDPTGAGEPANGATWGAAANSWYLTSGKKGFLIVGGAGNGLVNAQVISASGASVVGPYLKATFSLNVAGANSGVWQDTGWTLSLDPGSYILLGQITGLLQASPVSTPPQLLAKFQIKSGTGTLTGGAAIVFTATAAGASYEQTTPLVALVSVTATAVIDLYAQFLNATGSTVVSASIFGNDTSIPTHIMALQYGAAGSSGSGGYSGSLGG